MHFPLDTVCTSSYVHFWAKISFKMSILVENNLKTFALYKGILRRAGARTKRWTLLLCITLGLRICDLNFILIDNYQMYYLPIFALDEN